jgi:hypothetical protein
VTRLDGRADLDELARDPAAASPDDVRDLVARLRTAYDQLAAAVLHAEQCDSARCVAEGRVDDLEHRLGNSHANEADVEDELEKLHERVEAVCESLADLAFQVEALSGQPDDRREAACSRVANRLRAVRDRLGFGPVAVADRPDARAILIQALAEVGIEPCGDNSCIFGSPGGMATNGGCRCFDKGRALPPGVVHSLALAVRRLAARAESADVERIAKWLTHRAEQFAKCQPADRCETQAQVLRATAEDIRSGAWRTS